MKKTTMLLAALAMATGVFADDVSARPAGCILFSSTGPDLYADNTPVMDGEVYALVWSAEGSGEFMLNADGTPAGSGHVVVACAAVAKNGHCPLNCYILTEADRARQGGAYSVYLFDTRVTTVADDGKATVSVGKNKDGRFTSFNGFAKVNATVKVGGTTAATASQAVSGGTQTGLPADARKAVVTSMDMSVDGKVVLTVGDTLPCLNYTVVARDGVGPDAPAQVVATGVNGVAEGELRFIVEKGGDNRFYQVVRSGLVPETK